MGTTNGNYRVDKSYPLDNKRCGGQKKYSYIVLGANSKNANGDYSTLLLKQI